MPRSKFNPDTDIPDLSGKSIFITGGTSGLGETSAIQLAKHNPAHIYISGRNATTAETIINKIHDSNPTTQVTFVQCDLSSLSSVKEAAEKFVAQTPSLDILMCNAGIMARPPGLTADGYEIQFGTNHLGHALLIKKLLPLLERTAARSDGDARIVILASEGHNFHPKTGINFDDLRTVQDMGVGGSWIRYAQSKLANILYANELARRYPLITSVSLHPGVVSTGLLDNSGPMNTAFVYMTTWWQMKKPEEGTHNQLWASTVDKEKIQSGQYYVPVGTVPKCNVSKLTKDDALALKLWDWTEKALEGY